MEKRDHPDSILNSFWTSLLQSASKGTGVSKAAMTAMSKTVTKNLDDHCTANFDIDVQELLFLDSAQLEDRIASETRALRRDVRRTRRKQELLNEEKARLQAFRPARKATEQDESREIASKLDPMAKQFLSKKAGARDSMSSRSLQELGSAKRELESLEEGLIAYDDHFLDDLLKRLKPPKSKKQKK